MAPKAEQQHAETAAPAVPDLADDIAHMLRYGRMWGVKRVRRVVFIDEDGERSSISLPLAVVPVTPDDDDSDPPLSDVEQGIVDVLRRHPGRRMQANEIAPLLDEDEDPYGGTFKRAINRLKLIELIEGGKAEGGYRMKTKQK